MTSHAGLWRALRGVLLLAVLLAALAHATGVFPLRFVTEIDLSVADSRLRLFMPRTRDPRIVIVDVDEKSLAEIGRWPWGRDRMAAITDELFANQRAAVVGFDMLFAEPDASSGLPALERLAHDSPVIAAAVAPLRATLDFDARFAASLADRRAVLGYYLTNARDARKSGVLPAPVFDAALLKGRPIELHHWDGYGANIPEIARAATRAGYFNNVPDPDGLVRAVPLISEFGGKYYEPLSLAMYRAYTGEPNVAPGFPVQGWLPKDYRSLSSVQLVQGTERQAIPVDSRAEVLVPFRGPGGPHGGSFEYLSASDLLNHRVPSGRLAGKLVLVGTTAPGNYDQRSTPAGEVFPGVEVHANLLSGFLDGRLPVRPDWASSFEVIQLLVVASVLGWWLTRLHALRAAQLALALVAVAIATNLWAYAARGWSLPLASALVLAVLIYFGTTFWSYVVEGRSRRSLARLFGTYVPPELVDEMARDPAQYNMRAENRELTIMFCDMRNFTRVSELLAPEDVRSLVNSFFSTMTGAIREQRGTLDKYIGDAIMAFWGAPIADADHAGNAVRAAVAMTQRLKALNVDLVSRGLPEIGIGVGINTGVVCVGDMGSSTRRSYTVMGDAVNLASRIEGLTRHYGVDVLVGEATRNAVVYDTADTNGLLWRWVEVDKVRVKGKSKPVTLFTPVAVPAEAAVTFDEEMRLWRLALTACRLQHWADTHVHLHGLRTTFAKSPCSALYRQLAERTDHYQITPPPADWDGAHNFDSK
jgi:adenylate cyclase